METWLVTGSAGFLGTNAALFLKGRVHLVGQARQIRPSSHYPQIVGIDLMDSAGAGQMVRSVRPDVILHGAAVSGHETAAHDPEQAYAVNVLATKAIAEAACNIGARMVHISTDALFSGTRGNYREVDPVDPFSVYGETKFAGEEAVRAALEDHLIVRTNFFGWSETGRKSVLEFFVNSLRAGTGVRGYPDFIVTSMYVQSLLETIWALGELGAKGTMNVASSDALSKYDFGVEIARQFGLDSSLIAMQGPAEGEHATSRTRDLSLNTDLVASLTGGPMQTQSEGIRQSYSDEAGLAKIVRTR